MSVPTTQSNSTVVSFKKISETLRKMRMERDQSDVAIARDLYQDTQFKAVFNYRKHGREYIMKRDKDIARRYRLHNKQLV